MALDINQQFFLTLLDDYLNGLDTIRNDNTDIRVISDYADSHQMTAIVYYQCKNFSNDKHLREMYYSAIASYTSRKNIVKTITDALQAKNIAFFLVKGCEIAKLYPVPAFRTMGDLDIVVKDRKAAAEIIENLGFIYLRKENSDDWKFTGYGIKIELHDRLLYDSELNSEKLKTFFNNAWEFEQDHKLDHSFHFLYLMVHLRKHLMDYGVGFRQFFDIAVMTMNAQALNWKWIEENLIVLGLFPFARTVLALNECWFSVASPLNYDYVVTDEFFEVATKSIFQNGVFGYNNKDTVKNGAVNIISHSKRPYWTSFKRGLRKVLPSYDIMVYYGDYPFLKGKPILLPIAWVLRIYQGIIKGRLRTGINEAFISQDYIKERTNYLRMWGL